MSCPVCNNSEASATKHLTKDADVVRCLQCGDFTISRSAAANMRNEDESTRWRVSAWIAEYSPPMVTTADVETALESWVPSLHHRADRMLGALNRWYPQGFQFSTSEVTTKLMAIGWNRSGTEVRFMLEDVLEVELGYLRRMDSSTFRISARGLLHLEQKPNHESAIGFCAMWFNEQVLPLWTDVIEPAIRLAGYEPLRIDGKQHNGKIDDEIIASIRASRFVVSDFTGSRGGVYYEAGFAHGLGLPVIFMCQQGENLHFDVRQYNCLFWKPDDLESARTQLQHRILATLGRGPKAKSG